jgi:hypothetical protein
MTNCQPQTSLLSRADFFTCCIPDKLGGSGPPAEPVEILPGPSVQLLNSIRRRTDSILAIRSLGIRNTVCCACGVCNCHRVSGGENCGFDNEMRRVLAATPQLGRMPQFVASCSTAALRNHCSPIDRQGRRRRYKRLLIGHASEDDFPEPNLRTALAILYFGFGLI